ncbi:ArcA-like protein [Rutstroemia sp. NJR-2017a WRK4]|nr:ArcA-like protein [Rutstroemia sp. NJR-2017a WRK4]
MPRQTGGRAPRRVIKYTLVEEAPSHDGTLTMTAYQPKYEPHIRPLFAHRIYDTTPDAAIPGRAGELAKVIHEKTEKYREGNGRAEPDRIEVVALPMHEMRQLRKDTRMATREVDWELPKLIVERGYERAIIVIGRLGDEWQKAFDRPFELTDWGSERYKDWEWESMSWSQNLNSSDWATNPYGTYFLAEWDLEIVKYWQALMDEEGETMLPENITPHALVHLDRDLYNLRDSIESSYQQHSCLACNPELFPPRL